MKGYLRGTFEMISVLNMNGVISKSPFGALSVAAVEEIF